MANTVAVWIIVLLVPATAPGTKKLVVYEYGSKGQCQQAVPYIKRYHRLYGDRWYGKCSKTVRKRPEPRWKYTAR